MHVSSSKKFSGGIKVGNKPTGVQWKNMAAFSQNPLPALCPQGLAETTVLLWLPVREELQSSQTPLRNVANVSQSLMDIPKEEGKWRFNEDFPVK